MVLTSYAKLIPIEREKTLKNILKYFQNPYEFLHIFLRICGSRCLQIRNLFFHMEKKIYPPPQKKVGKRPGLKFRLFLRVFHAFFEKCFRQYCSRKQFDFLFFNPRKSPKKQLKKEGPEGSLVDPERRNWGRSVAGGWPGKGREGVQPLPRDVGIWA